MAKLPLMLAEGRLPGKAAAVGIERPDLYGTAGARALTGFGNALEGAGLEVAAIEKNARDTRDVISATADAAQQLDAYRIELDSDADYAGRASKFEQRAQQLKAKLAEKMSGSAALDFEKSFERSYAVLSHSLRDKARKDEIEEHATKLDEANTKLLDVAIREPDPRKKAMHLEQIAANIEQARAANILSKPQADRIHKATLEKFEALQVTELRRTNPAAALRLLTAEEGRGGLKYLDPLKKRELALAIQQDLQRRSALASIVARATVAEAASLFNADTKPDEALLEKARLLAKGNKSLTDTLDRAEGNYHAAQQFVGMDAGERRQAIDAIREKKAGPGLTGDEANLLARYMQSEQLIRTAFARNPMGTAMLRDPQAAQALAEAERAGDVVAFRAATETLLERQMKDGGLPRHAVTVMPKEAAEAAEAALSGPSSPAQGQAIARLQHFYGPEYMPRLMAQLDKGEKIPGHVQVIAALGVKAENDPDIKRILDASKPTEKDWAAALDEDTRKEVRRQVGEAGVAVRDVMARLPGGLQRYGQFSRTVTDVAYSLLVDKGAGSAPDAAKKAWAIVHDRHFALAYNVSIPKVNGVPIADPKEIAAYQDYALLNIDKYNIAPPPETPATRHLTPQQRLDMKIRAIKTFGTFVTDRDNRGMVLYDELNIPVPLKSGPLLRIDFEAPQKNEDFKKWWGPRQSGHPGTWRPDAAPAPDWMRGTR